MPKIHVIAVTYERFGEMRVFVQSMLNQTFQNWSLTIIHDGPSDSFELIMEEYLQSTSSKIEYFATDFRYNDYGHSLREIGLKNIKGDYVLLTNADNYFIPKAIEFITSAINQSSADVVLFDMVHSHEKPGGRLYPPYSYFQTSYHRGSIDISAAVVKKDLAERAGFRDKTHDGDATYFEDILAVSGEGGLKLSKVPSILFVHN